MSSRKLDAGEPDGVELSDDAPRAAPRRKESGAAPEGRSSNDSAEDNGSQEKPRLHPIKKKKAVSRTHSDVDQEGGDDTAASDDGSLDIPLFPSTLRALILRDLKTGVRNPLRPLWILIVPLLLILTLWGLQAGLVDKEMDRTNDGTAISFNELYSSGSLADVAGLRPYNRLVQDGPFFARVMAAGVGGVLNGGRLAQQPDGPLNVFFSNGFTEVFQASASEFLHSPPYEIRALNANTTLHQSTGDVTEAGTASATAEIIFTTLGTEFYNTSNKGDLAGAWPSFIVDSVVDYSNASAKSIQAYASPIVWNKVSPPDCSSGCDSNTELTAARVRELILTAQSNIAQQVNLSSLVCDGGICSSKAAAAAALDTLGFAGGAVAVSASDLSSGSTGGATYTLSGFLPASTDQYPFASLQYNTTRSPAPEYEVNVTCTDCNQFAAGAGAGFENAGRGFSTLNILQSHFASALLRNMSGNATVQVEARVAPMNTHVSPPVLPLEIALSVVTVVLGTFSYAFLMLALASHFASRRARGSIDAISSAGASSMTTLLWDHGRLVLLISGVSVVAGTTAVALDLRVVTRSSLASFVLLGAVSGHVIAGFAMTIASVVQSASSAVFLGSLFVVWSTIHSVMRDFAAEITQQVPLYREDAGGLPSGWMLFPIHCIEHGFFTLMHTSVSSSSSVTGEFGKVVNYAVGAGFLWLLLGHFVQRVLHQAHHPLFPLQRAYYFVTKHDLPFFALRTSQVRGKVDSEIVLEARDVSTRFRDFSLVPPLTRSLVQGVSFSLQRGQALGIVAGAGHGKRVLARVLGGLERPASGEVFGAGFRLRTSAALLQRHVRVYAYDPKILSPHATVRETLLFYARLSGISAKDETEVVENVIARLGLKRFTLSKTISALSDGAKRLVAFGTAVIGQHDVLVLHCPTSGLDAEARLAVLRVLVEEKETHGVAIVTDDPQDCMCTCDYVSVCSGGQCGPAVPPEELAAAAIKAGNAYAIQVCFRSKQQAASVQEFTSTLAPGVSAGASAKSAGSIPRVHTARIRGGGALDGAAEAEMIKKLLSGSRAHGVRQYKLEKGSASEAVLTKSKTVANQL